VSFPAQLAPRSPVAPDLGSIRREVIDALAAAAPDGTSTALGPVRSVHLPAYVVSPGVPYVTPTPDAYACAFEIRLIVYALVGAEVVDPTGTLEYLAAIAEPALGAIRNATYGGITELGSLIDGPGGVSCRMAALELIVKR
jgi:hypothetical protein